MRNMTEQENTEKKGNELLMKYLAGTASGNEISELRHLAGENPDLKKELDESDKVIGRLNALDLMKKVDTPSAFSKLKKRISGDKNLKGWFYYWQKIAAILLLPFIAVSVFQFFTSRQQPATVSSSVIYNEIKTSPGLRSDFQLPDGTKVWLNGSTKIKYPIAFTGKERRIFMEGEAYFEVAKNKKKPFVVDMGTLQVQAVGTAFNCMAYPDDHLVETTLAEGKVKITRLAEGQAKGEYMLNPGQILTYKLNSDKFYLQQGDLSKHLSWLNGKFMFRNDPLEEVCKQLGRWFNADIEIKDEVLRTYSFTGTFHNEGLREILDLISLTSPISYTITERDVNKNNEYGKLKVYVKKK